MTRCQSVIRAAALLALPLLGHSAAAGTSELESTLERCASAPSSDARIVCLEQALAAAHGVDAGAPAPETPPAAVPEPTEPRPSAPAAPAALGAEQIAARDRARRADDPERMRAQITDHTIVGYRTLQVQLDNGQIWRQLSADTQRLRLPAEGELTVEIWASRYGGYQMRLEELRRTIRVERVR